MKISNIVTIFIVSFASFVIGMAGAAFIARAEIQGLHEKVLVYESNYCPTCGQRMEVNE